MRLTWLHLTFSIALFGGITVNGEHHAVFPRQDSSPSPLPSSSASSIAQTSSATASTSSHDTARSSNGGSSTPASAGSSSAGAPSSTSQPAKTTLSTSASNNTLSPVSDTALVASATPTASGISSLPANGKKPSIHGHVRRRTKPFRHRHRRPSSPAYSAKDHTGTLCGRCNLDDDGHILYSSGDQDKMVSRECSLEDVAC